MNHIWDTSKAHSVTYCNFIAGTNNDKSLGNIVFIIPLLAEGIQINCGNHLV